MNQQFNIVTQSMENKWQLSLVPSFQITVQIWIPERVLVYCILIYQGYRFEVWVYSSSLTRPTSRTREYWSHNQHTMQPWRLIQRHMFQRQCWYPTNDIAVCPCEFAVNGSHQTQAQAFCLLITAIASSNMLVQDAAVLLLPGAYSSDHISLAHYRLLKFKAVAWIHQQLAPCSPRFTTEKDVVMTEVCNKLPC